MFIKENIKKIVIFPLVISFLLVFCSCNKNLDDNTENNVIAMDNKNIKIYRQQYDRSIQDAVSQFKNKYPDVTVHEDIINDYSELSTKLNTELMAGEGPDVIKAQVFMFNSLYKLLNTNVFSNIDEFIQNDKEFDMSIYNKTVLDSGVYRGERYFIPLGFKLPYLWTTQGVLNKSGISFDMDNWTWKQLKEKAKAFTANSKSGEKRYLFPIQYDLFYCLLVSSGIEYIDYDIKKAYFDSPQFMVFLETYKLLYNDLATPEVLKRYTNFYFDMLKDSSLLAVSGSDGRTLNPGMLWMNNSSTNYYLNEDILVYPFPTYKKEDKPIAQPVSIAAINNKSKSKYSAYNFIKILLSNEVQTSNSFMNSEGIPVNNTAIDQMIQKYTGSDGIGDMTSNSVKVPTVPLPKELAEQAKKVANGIDKCGIMDQSILQFIGEEVQNFIDGKITAEQAGDKINNKVQLFLSE